MVPLCFTLRPHVFQQTPCFSPNPVFFTPRVFHTPCFPHPCFPHPGTPHPGTPAPRFPPSPFLFVQTHLTVLGKKHTQKPMRSISCSLQLRLNSNKSKKMVINRWNERSDYIYFLNSSERDCHSRKWSFHSSFDLSGLAQSAIPHNKQITVIRLRSSARQFYVNLLRLCT